MRSLKISLAVFFVAVAAVLGLLLLRNSSPASTKAALWSTGDAWRVTVRQAASNVSPNAPKAGADNEIVYRFHVGAKPKGTSTLWRVDVLQDGASGPFVSGWHLFYRQDRDGSMKLTKVSQGDQKAAAAEVATIVLGMSFPYETKYTKHPAATATIAESDLIARSSTPPPLTDDATGASATAKTTVSGGSTSGAGIPDDAPVVPAGGTPPGAPQG